eukprot:gnl/MRDRNA2_/MRDRNA2_32855_c0_seq1.p1 gnl/MRDRNA2_/MRDRNA2_32855_c0~~gnl/MRDRNA2_/MRDRNA2_32855_c0_seq1.p1  ORF type:complete len:339 (-),score=85.62 gnl/MRDRNA2_/MRDRNA2_32855_c0_seq1:36-974(-)
MAGLDLKGRVALVTGAGAGLGRSYAMMLADMGASVLINDPGQDKATGASLADQVVAEIEAKGGKAAANKDFVGKDYDATAKVVKAAVDAFGKIDIIINNAGVLRDVSFGRQSSEQWSLIQEIHLYGQRNVCKAAWEHMRSQKYGRIVNISSINGVRGQRGQTNYSAAKAGIIGFSKALAKEGERDNIKVNVIVPAGGTAMTATILPKEVVDAFKPEFAAPMVCFLCTEATEVPNGRIFEAGGGYFAEIQWRRSEGMFFDLANPASVQDIQKNWTKITDMTNCTDPVAEDDGGIPKQMRQVLASMDTGKSSKL